MEDIPVNADSASPPTKVHSIYRDIISSENKTSFVTENIPWSTFPCSSNKLD